MRESIADIVRHFLDSISYEMRVLSWQSSPTLTVIEVLNPLHIRAGLSIDVDGTPYEVDSVQNMYFMHINAEILNPTEFVTFPRPMFIHGTPMKVNEELGTIKEADKLPFIWLYEVIKDRKILKPDSDVDREATISLHYLDAKSDGWVTADTYLNTVDRMSALAEYIEGKILASPLFCGESIEYIDYFAKADFGRFVDNKGFVAKIFDEILAGTEQRFTLPVKNSLTCS